MTACRKGLSASQMRPLVRKVAAVIVMATWCALASAAGAQTPSEHLIKAAFLYNFAKFVEWPAKAFPSAKTPLTICILGEDPFGSDLDETIDGETVNERKLVAKRVKRVQDGEPCHVLFISSSEKERLPEVLGAVKRSSMLTVGETERFAKLGGIINFTLEENKVRFEINVDAADRAGLKISSKLLKLARVIRDEGKS